MNITSISHIFVTKYGNTIIPIPENRAIRFWDFLPYTKYAKPNKPLRKDNTNRYGLDKAENIKHLPTML